VRVSPPDGTFYCFADFSAYDRNSARLAQTLLEKVRVLVMPGVEFGLDGHLRISFCGGIKDITEGIERMKWVLDPEAPNELYLGTRKLIRDW
jgi:aspartate/methionine/tyrosine aminotransferase